MMTSKLVCECGVVNDNDARYCKMCGLGKEEARVKLSVLDDYRQSKKYSWGDEHGICTNG